jgi:outer membrane cobalamin receptor
MHSSTLTGTHLGALARTRILSTVGATALLAAFSAGARAQTAAADQTETVVVSASRITASGFAAPTPTTVVGVADIQQNAKPNVFDTITQLPSLTASTGAQVNNGNTSTGANGLSQFNLRGLGTIRTLTLIDSQRIVPAYVTGTADVSELPQMLVQRVDVVTGGASASWGSDAVGGVINFVTDKKFNGFKGNIQGGESTYGDDISGTVQVAAGTGLFNDQAHIEAAAEFYHSDGLPPKPLLSTDGLVSSAGRCCSYGAGNLTYTQPQFDAKGQPILTSATPPTGYPLITPIYLSQSISSSEYGLITGLPSGASAAATAAFKYQAFDANGNLAPFRSAINANGLTATPPACVATTCQGGDRLGQIGRTAVEDPITRSIFYTRLSYDVAPGWEVYGTFNFGNVWSANSPGLGTKTGLAIACGNAAGGPNAYLSAAVNATCVANKITSFTIGVSYDAFPVIRMQDIRQQRRYVLGTDGAFNMFGSDWTFDAYYQHGENDSSVHIENMILTGHYNAAADAVVGPGGTIICRANLPGQATPAPGCAPFQAFGGGVISQAALNYVDPPVRGTGPVSRTYERQEAAAIAINGTPFKDWAGDVALAFGMEYREEAYATAGDPYGDTVTAANPFTATYPADPQLTTNGGNYLAGNYHVGSGNYHVYEAFVEAGIPLIDTPEWGKANLNIAGRGTDYSTSGYVQTWKVGTTWDTPVDGIRLRALQSRDVRAPNLSELFAATVSMNNGVIDRTLPASAPNVNILSNAIGNPNLKPETAQTTEVGVIYQPSYLAGLSLSVDYYRVGIKKQIGSLTNQQTVDLCQIQLNLTYCSYFNLHGVSGTQNPSYVNLPPFNLAQTVTDGFDVEASYQFDLQDWGIPGRFVARALANHVSKYISDTGVAGQPIAEYAGATGNASGTTGFGGGVPLWKAFFTQSWTDDAISLNLTERLFSDGVVNPYGIVCQAPNCPTPTVQHPTYASQNISGYTFYDLGGSYRFNENLQAYFKIDNIGDKLANPVAGLNADPIGRVYRIGVRFNN